MTNVYLDPDHSDDERRRRLYAGDLYVHAARPSTVALAQWAQQMVRDAFAPHDPLTAQYDLPVEAWVERFAPVKPAFIHHPHTRELLLDVFTDLGCDLEQTYLDVPRLRGVTSDGYLTSGVGFAHHPHRDTWYSAPACQVNWWMPLWPVEAESGMAFHPRYFAEAVPNGSAHFDYYEWNATSRKDAARHIHGDSRKQPKPETPLELEPDLRVMTPPGGVLAFSPSHLHSTVPNTLGTTRFSIDIRTVHAGDVAARRGAPNVDAQPRGTSLRDFTLGPDRLPMPEDLVGPYDVGSTSTGPRVFRPV